MLISKVVIHDFKGFDLLEIPNLTKINLFGGKNNVGKSSILEAIFLALDRLNPHLFLRQLEWRTLGPIEMGESIWTPFFRNNSGSGNNTIKIELELSSKQLLAVSFAKGITSQVINTNQGKLKSSTSQPPSFGSTKIGANALSIKASLDAKNIQDSIFRVNGAQIGFEHKHLETIGIIYARAMMTRHMSQAEEADLFSKLDADDRTAPVIEAIRGIDERIESISIGVSAGSPRLQATLRGIKGKIPLALLGDGSRRIAGMVMAILERPKSIILIDEIETGIHHSKMSTMWTAIARAAEVSESQVLATTHSRECIEAASHAMRTQSSSELFSYHRVQRKPDLGKLSIVRYSGEEVAMASEGEVEIR
ncbi:ATP/GTP-binding protein [Inhella sp.]|uniref:AAA family ATPase n=1 Tax=Inhella sp. TaxID=1921806 RepID=UPI0035AF3C66